MRGQTAREHSAIPVVRCHDRYELAAYEGLSWAPVLDEARAPVGVVSAADLLRARSVGRDAAAPAWQLCSYKPVTVTPNASAGEVAHLMVQCGIHHVVVMEEGPIAGVVSALDLLRCLIDEVAPTPSPSRAISSSGRSPSSGCTFTAATASRSTTTDQPSVSASSTVRSTQ